jgi:hypothetical protein
MRSSCAGLTRASILKNALRAMDCRVKPGNDETAVRYICEYGCTVISIPWGEKQPPFSFSVGLFANYDHPERSSLACAAKTGARSSTKFATTSRPVANSPMAISPTTF